MDGKVAFVTGASYGVGEAAAIALAQQDYNIALSATNAENLITTQRKLSALGVDSLPVVLNLKSQKSIEEATREVTKELGVPDVLVNNAATIVSKPALDLTWEDWSNVINTNLTGTFFLTREIGRKLIEREIGGSIINIASTHGIVGAANRSVYGISKAGVIQMTKMLAIEWAEHNIRVNGVAPGRLETPSPARSKTSNDPQYMSKILKRIPLHRITTVEEVAAAICFLAGPGAASITGQTLILDGGVTTA